MKFKYNPITDALLDVAEHMAPPLLEQMAQWFPWRVVDGGVEVRAQVKEIPSSSDFMVATAISAVVAQEIVNSHNVVLKEKKDGE